MNGQIIIQNISDYNQQIIGGNLVLTKIENSKKEDVFSYVNEKIENLTDLLISSITKDSLQNVKNNDNEMFEHLIKNKKFIKSNILECKINGIKQNKLKFLSTLVCLYVCVKNRGQNFKYNTKFKIRDDKANGENGYYYHPELKVSIQNKDANQTLNEIINYSKINNIKIELKIQLKNGEIVKYVNE